MVVRVWGGGKLRWVPTTADFTSLTVSFTDSTSVIMVQWPTGWLGERLWLEVVVVGFVVGCEVILTQRE